jgi:hypothetical protein
MADVTIDIKGRPWKFVLLPDKRYDKLYNEDPEDMSAAITLPGIYEVHFRKSDWDIVTIRHEIMHVLYNASLVSSADLKIHDVQEICAEIVGQHASEIVVWSDRVAQRFFGRE